MSRSARAYAGELEIDVAIAHASGTRFRLNGFTNRAGAAAAFRTIPAAVPSLEQLDGPPVLQRIAKLDNGLVLVTGPTGSGKSTTLAALIDHINTTAERHILTIEDPIEFVHRSKRSLINQREIGRDTRSFARALRSALRADPDVILVGELRDHETIALALTAAETGHLVLATLHTTSAAKTIDRLIDVVPSGDKPMVRTMLSSSLQAVIAQTLLRRADGAGRVAAYEVLIVTAAVANLIRENQIAQLASMMQTGARFGMQRMRAADPGPGRQPADRAGGGRARPARAQRRAPERRARGRRAAVRRRRGRARLRLRRSRLRARQTMPRHRRTAPACAGARGVRRAVVALTAPLLLIALVACEGTLPVMDHDRYGELTRDDFRDALEPRPVPSSTPADAAGGPAIPDLRPLIELPPPLSPAERKLVSLSVNETVPLKDVLIELGRRAEVDLELDPQIAGGVILTMRERPLREVIERIADLAGLRFAFQGSSLRIERDLPYYLNYRVDYLHLTRQANSVVETSVNVMGGDQGTDGNASSSAVSGQSDVNFWHELEDSLGQILLNSRPRELTGDPGRGAARAGARRTGAARG